MNFNYISNPPIHIEKEKSVKEKPSTDVGYKESEGKLYYELDWDFIKQMAERMAINKSKYGKWNWQKPIDVEELKQSLLRHTIAIIQGDSNEDHLAAVACNAMIISHQQGLELFNDLVKNEIDLKKLSKQFPNDEEFGEVIRDIIR